MRTRAGGILVVTALFATLAVGLVLKAPCADLADWSDGRPYLRFCYTDIVPLYGTEALSGDRLPYLDLCPDPLTVCDEYPLLTMYSMRAAATLGNALAPGTAAFFYSNVLLLVLAAIVTTLLLWRLVGRKALFFAASPTLLLYGFMNWDLIAVLFATLGLYLLFQKRDVLAGVALGFGAAAKLYPAVILIPQLLERRRSSPSGAEKQLKSSIVSWVALNLPFAIFGPVGWMVVFALRSDSPLSQETMLHLGCHFLTDVAVCAGLPFINWLSPVLFVLTSVALYRICVRIDPGFQRWTFCFPLLIVLLLTAKLYSPQFSLWLAPLFALVLPSWRWFAALQVTEIALFAVRFSWIGTLADLPGAGFEAFQVASLVHHLVLVGCVWPYLQRVRRDDFPVAGDRS